jgi:DNA-binding transcriptional regulator YiaG
MTAADLRTLLNSLGLSQVGAARLLGKNPRTVRKWVLDEAPVDETAARFLQYILAKGDSADEAMRVLEPFLHRNEAPEKDVK